ncbi:MAG TPA: hypothetical protein VFO93_18040 [Hymenobacter sp.]|uniref:hypothetical protein n=1 Tax=Hymenobacter sp. TaxID=1898978 RepID=UPI002D7EE1F9|nr:hypothetical protein [Hymenobacter sp.]HET9505449.1 hypothetical protein [Hymenobacter sp.]
MAAPPAGRFLGLLGLLLLAGCAGYAALVLQTASGPVAVGLRQRYPYEWAARAYSAADYEALRWLLRGLAAGAAVAAGWLAATRRGRAEVRALGQEVAGAGRGLGAGWRTLAPAQRRWASVGLLGLTALRLYWSAVAQPYDDATSYELFVREPLLAVSAVYALPNNHVLSNTLSWGFYQVHPGFWWAMRLPVLLTSAVATGFWFLGLRRRSGFEVAGWAVLWFGMLGQSLHYAATGRGYWLLVGLGGVGFFALLELARPAGGRARAAWAALVLSGVLGLYTVPTHALLLASVYSWLAWRAVRAGRARQLLFIGGMGGLTLLGAAVLYAPLLLLSGPAALLHNPYVQALSVAEFWHLVPEGLRETHHLLMAPLVLAVLGGFGYLWRLGRAGRLPAGLRRPVVVLGGPSVWFFVLPYVLAAALRLPLPERTLFYKAQYVALLAALLAAWGGWRVGPRARRPLRCALLAGTLLLAGSQLWQLQRQEALWQRGWGWQLGAPLIDWLAAQPPGAVLVARQPEVVRFYAHTRQRHRAWQIEYAARPGVRYRYLIVQPGAPGPPGGKLAFRNALAAVFVLY